MMCALWSEAAEYNWITKQGYVMVKGSRSRENCWAPPSRGVAADLRQFL